MFVSLPLLNSEERIAINVNDVNRFICHPTVPKATRIFMKNMGSKETIDVDVDFESVFWGIGETGWLNRTKRNQ